MRKERILKILKKRGEESFGKEDSNKKDNYYISY